MQYTKTNWKNNQAPSIDQTNLNKIEQGLSNAAGEINNLSNSRVDQYDMVGAIIDVLLDYNSGVVTLKRYNAPDMVIPLYLLVPNAKYVKNLMSDLYDLYNGKLQSTIQSAQNELQGYVLESLDNANDAESWKNEAEVYAERAGDYASDSSSYSEEASEYLAQCREYYQIIDDIISDLNGLVWAGSVNSVDELPTTNDTNTVYNMKNDFITTEAFVEGPGKAYPQGTNVLWTSYNKWDILGGYGVASIIDQYGNKLRGYVEISPFLMTPFYLDGDYESEYGDVLDIDGNIRLKKIGDNYGCTLYFGDDDYCFIDEYLDDVLRIHCSDLVTDFDNFISDNEISWKIGSMLRITNNYVNESISSELQIYNDVSEYSSLQFYYDSGDDVLKRTLLTANELFMSYNFEGDISTIKVKGEGVYLSNGIRTTNIENSSIISVVPSSSYILKLGTSISGVTGSGLQLIFDASISSIHPNGNGIKNLGYSTKKWNNIYAQNGTIQTSDRSKKTNIQSLNYNKIKDFYMGLNPSSYNMIDGTSGRTHWGMVAQDIEELMNVLGMESTDFAGFIKSPKTIDKEIEVEKEILIDQEIEEEVNGKIVKKNVQVPKKIKDIIMQHHIIENEYEYSLRYDEFIAPTICMIQNHERRIEDLEEENKKLKQAISDLYTLYNELAIKNGINVRKLTAFEVENLSN